MKRRNAITMISLVLVACACFAERPSAGNGEIYGFSSDESGDSSYLGVDTRDVTSDRITELHLKEETGVEITMVDQDAPAGKVGLKEQDVILTLNGEKVESVEQLRRMIRETPSGRVITLGISRNGQPMTFKVQLADRKDTVAHGWGSKVKDFHFDMPAMPTMPEIDMPVSVVVVHSSARSGLMVENLTPQLGDFFGVKNGEGVLIRSVEKGSRADKAGFRAGDVIVKINGESIHDSSDFSHALRSRQGNTASVLVLRDKREQTITLTLPERRQSGRNRETLNLPGFDAETLQLGQLASEWARIEPQMEEAINRRMADIKPETERARQEYERHRREFERAMHDVERQLCEHQRELDKALRYAWQTGGAEI
ncbi:MAG: PDZ domain-containing protein [Acidobacteriaceae bacterium]|nr:PDZ domain-containing protein [Acidobacteriaceae bacterium]